MNALGEAETVAHWITLVPARVKAGVLLALAGSIGASLWTYHERSIGAVQCLADETKASTAAQVDRASQVATIRTLEAVKVPDLGAKMDSIQKALPGLRAKVAAPPQVINKQTCEYPQEAIDAYNAIN